eukprot:1161050-Pelagomonas_calceolata.AAC.13
MRNACCCHTAQTPPNTADPCTPCACAHTDTHTTCSAIQCKGGVCTETIAQAMPQTHSLSTLTKHASNTLPEHHP